MHRNTILYSTMIKSYAKQKKLRKALRIMEEMQAEGVPPAPATPRGIASVRYHLVHRAAPKACFSSELREVTS